jgi:hypothetical protein
MKFGSILSKYRTQAIVSATGAHADTVRGWKRGDALPEGATRINALAAFLEIDSSALLDILAEDSRLIEASRASIVGAA